MAIIIHDRHTYIGKGNNALPEASWKLISADLAHCEVRNLHIGKKIEILKDLMISKAYTA